MICLTTLRFQITTGQGALPVAGAVVTVGAKESDLHRTLVTDSSGATPPLCLETRPHIPGWEDLGPQASPYDQYHATVTAPGFRPVELVGIQVFRGVDAIQPVSLLPLARGQEATPLVVVLPPMGPARLAEELPQRPPEEPPRPAPQPAVPSAGDETTQVPQPAVLPAMGETDQVPQASPPRPNPGGASPEPRDGIPIPAYLTIHLGSPDDTAAPNVIVPFADYIRQVASGLLVPTWPENALRAAICAQVTFTLHRLHTRWYPDRGYPFNLTASGDYDQPYAHGGTVFGNISRLVDQVFAQYLCLDGAPAPLFTPSTARRGGEVPGALCLWGAVALAQNGYTTLSILKRYFGGGARVIACQQLLGVQSPYPGRPLAPGSSGAGVRTVEVQLNRIRRHYPAIPFIAAPDHQFTAETAAAVTAFQRVFHLPPTGQVDGATWNKLSGVYLAVRRLAQLDPHSLPLPDAPPTTLLGEGDQGGLVPLAQYCLGVVSRYWDRVAPADQDGTFGPATRRAVTGFQNAWGLPVDGVLGPETWATLLDACLGIAATCGLELPYPGAPLHQGSRGGNTWLLQRYLGAVGGCYPLPPLVADGLFGPRTQEAVAVFQRMMGLPADGVVDRATWDRVVVVRLML